MLIPVLLNNSNPTLLRYSITALDTGKVEVFELNQRDMKSIESAHSAQLQLTQTSSPSGEESEDDWDGEDEEEEIAQGGVVRHSLTYHHKLEKTQALSYIRVTKPGLVRLDQASESGTNDARILHNDVLVVPCPQADFTTDAVVKGDSVRCTGTREELSIRVYGVAPLTLKWRKEINGRREYFSVDGINGNPEVCVYPTSDSDIDYHSALRIPASRTR